MQWCDPVPYAQLETETEILPESFFARPTEEVARELLGKVLVHRRMAGMIVEVEAYLGEQDLAAHASRWLTPRTRVLFGPPGRAYVYFVYGMHECLNIVAEPDGVPGCVLIRALEPLTGIAQMHQRRPAARSLYELTSGPGRLTAALGITRRLYGANLTQPGPFTVRRWLRAPPFQITSSARIGIRHCKDWPLRFFIAGNRFVSRP